MQTKNYEKVYWNKGHYGIVYDNDRSAESAW